MFLWILLILVVAGLAYVRLAPSDPATWHQRSSVTAMGEKKFKSGYIWREAVEGDGSDRLRALDALAQATPRTTLLAGSVEEGQVTYVTRTQWAGFPDYTTISVAEGTLEIHARLRFGQSDLGVNAKRVKSWRAALEG